jgi:hypothetical protein
MRFSLFFFAMAIFRVSKHVYAAMKGKYADSAGQKNINDFWNAESAGNIPICIQNVVCFR